MWLILRVTNVHLCPYTGCTILAINGNKWIMSQKALEFDSPYAWAWVLTLPAVARRLSSVTPAHSSLGRLSSPGRLSWSPVRVWPGWWVTRGLMGILSSADNKWTGGSSVNYIRRYNPRMAFQPGNLLAYHNTWTLYLHRKDVRTVLRFVRKMFCCVTGARGEHKWSRCNDHWAGAGAWTLGAAQAQVHWPHSILVKLANKIHGDPPSGISPF